MTKVGSVMITSRCTPCVLVGVAASTLLLSGASAETWRMSGHTTPFVQAVELDASKRSIFVLIATDTEESGDGKKTMRIVEFDANGVGDASEVTLNETFEIRGPVSLYPDSKNDRYVIAHDSSVGSVIRTFNGRGKQIEVRHPDFGEAAVIGITRHNGSFRYFTFRGIYSLEAADSPRAIYSVSDDEYISSVHGIEHGDCSTAVVVGSARQSTWDLRVLCNDDKVLTTRQRVLGSPAITPSIFTRVVRSSQDAKSFWVVGPNDEGRLKIAKCELSGGALCTSTASVLPPSGGPMVASHVPVTMISDSKVAVAIADEDTSSLEVYDLNGNRMSKHELGRNQATGSTTGLRKISAVDLLAGPDIIWALTMTISIPSTDKDEFVEKGYMFQIESITYRLADGGNTLQLVENSR